MRQIPPRGTFGMVIDDLLQRLMAGGMSYNQATQAIRELLAWHQEPPRPSPRRRHRHRH